MIVTKDFVFIHIPKTGGTYVTLLIRDVYTPGLLEKFIHRFSARSSVNIPLLPYRWKSIGSQHSMRKHIPQHLQGLPLVSCIRAPFSLLASHYTFGWWRDHPEVWFADVDSVVKEFGSLSSFRFLDFARAAYKHNPWALKYRGLPGVGLLSAEFAHFFSRETSRLKSLGSDGYDSFFRFVSDEVRSVRFLRQEHLNEDLLALFRDFGIDEGRTTGLLQRPPINVSRGRSNLGTEEEIEQVRLLVRNEERLIHDLFPHLTGD